MPLIYVTGPSGAGKSTLKEELEKRGYEAHDTDETINEWVDKDTGEVTQYTQRSINDLKDWVANNNFLMSEARVERLAEQANDRLIFICGHAGNDLDMMRYFDKVICLMISMEHMEQRVTARQNNHWGHEPDQVAIMKKWYQPTIDRYRNVGATMVDATQPVETVAGEVVRISSQA